MFTAYPVSTSVRVNASIECTPGASAKKFILTDWQVDGRNGLRQMNQPNRRNELDY